MIIRNTKEPILLFLGDALMFLIALWVTLLLRYLEVPGREVFFGHLVPFAFLFASWTVVFYIAGLYGKHTLILKHRLPTTMLNVQIANTILAISFFYFIPYFDITPKTNLFIYLALSFVFILAWRLYGYDLFGMRQPRQRALLVGSGEEMRELLAEVNHNPRYNLKFTASIDLEETNALDFQKDIVDVVRHKGITLIVISLHSKKVEPVLPRFYDLLFSGVRFIDMHKVYEDIFDRVPVSITRHSWFLENISLTPHRIYDILKRGMDIALSAFLGALSLVFYPLVFACMKLDDGGPIFIKQERTGENNRPINIVKFRTMRISEGVQPSLLRDSADRITRVGAWLRKTRLDEIPQLWNVLKGDLSLVGPRPELPDLAALYDRQVPYYHVRHLIKPGLSGWAQLHHEKHPHHGADVRETTVKLSYDLFYIKNRSFLLDLEIALKTIRTLLSRSGI